MKKTQTNLTKIKVFHHNDMDGYSAALVFKKLYNAYLKDEDIEYYSIDYTVDVAQYLDDEPTLLVFLDYSFSAESNIKAVSKACKNGSKLIWIDHHQSSFKLNIIEAFHGSIIYLNRRRSGAYLTWHAMHLYRYFHGTVSESIKLDGNAIDRFYDIFKYILDEYLRLDGSCTLISEDTLDVLNQEAPIHIMMIDAYDRFDKHNKYYDRGVLLSQWFFVRVNDLNNTTFNTLFDLDVIYDLNHVAELNNIITESTNVIKPIIQALNDNFREEYKFEIVILYGDLSNVKQATAICCNRQMNSLGFSEDYNKYDISIPFFYNGKTGKWSYSMYTNNPELNVGSICEYLGGGGHRGAAGFTSNKNIFDNLKVDNHGRKILDTANYDQNNEVD